MQLPQFVHETLVREIYRDQIVGHIARDSTAIEAREHYPDLPVKVTGTTVPKQEKLWEPSVETTAPVKASAADSQAPRKRGPKPGRRGAHKRWKGGKPRKQLPQGTRLERQRTQTLPKMLGELPQECNLGAKKNSNGNTEYWRGYKLHWDVADGQVPISAVLTSASVHDSQVAIPLMTMSSERVPFYCYELMDSAYDAAHIHEHSREMGHVPIVDPHPHGKKDEKGKYPNMRQLSWAETDRYKERTMVERVNARLKDEFGGRYVRVRGAAKVMAHLMFGVLALTADQILRLVVKQI